jgi:hypothetical protein
VALSRKKTMVLEGLEKEEAIDDSLSRCGTSLGFKTI